MDSNDTEAQDETEAEPELPLATHFLYALEDTGSVYAEPRPLRLSPGTLYPRSMTTPEFLARLAQDGVVTPVAVVPGVGTVLARA